ncbi:MAG TPA: TadE/TadG family type IV pilus assembly protein [Sphingomicrobium sp.]
MKSPLPHLISDTGGSAGAELALALPLLLVLIFASFDAGNYFLAEHVVQKAVRDAARYAARLPYADYPSCTVPSGGVAEQQTQRVARSGDPTGAPGQRLAGWTSDSMTTVTISCAVAGSFNNGGIYKDFPAVGGVTGAAPIVTVSATVPYTPLFGYVFRGLTLNASAGSQAALIGA